MLIRTSFFLLLYQSFISKNMYFNMPISTQFSILIRKRTIIFVLLLKGKLIRLLILVLNSVFKSMLNGYAG
jgi:hypothetical protein